MPKKEKETRKLCLSQDKAQVNRVNFLLCKPLVLRQKSTRFNGKKCFKSFLSERLSLRASSCSPPFEYSMNAYFFRRVGALCLSVVVALVAACKSEPTVSDLTTASPLGRWILQSAGSPPTPVPLDLRRLIGEPGLLASGSLDIRADGSHTLYLDRRIVLASGDTTRSPVQSSGSTLIRGLNLQLQRPDGSLSIADFGPRYLTLRHSNMTLFFRRDTT